MTNEERQELCNDLRLYIPTHSRLYQAAAELERLVKRVIELEQTIDEIEKVCKYGPIVSPNPPK